VCGRGILRTGGGGKENGESDELEEGGIDESEKALASKQVGPGLLLQMRGAEQQKIAVAWCGAPGTEQKEKGEERREESYSGLFGQPRQMTLAVKPCLPCSIFVSVQQVRDLAKAAVESIDGGYLSEINIPQQSKVSRFSPTHVHIKVDGQKKGQTTSMAAAVRRS